jgi:hypothetical protein
LDRTNSSLAGSAGSSVFQHISPKKRQAAMSAADRQVVGCPDPDAVVMRREWMRSRVAILRRSSILAMGWFSSIARGHVLQGGMITRTLRIKKTRLVSPAGKMDAAIRG